MLKNYSQLTARGNLGGSFMMLVKQEDDITHSNDWTETVLLTRISLSHDH
jgi:hypothetical protein